MYPIFYRTLNSQLMKAMKAGEVSIDEVKEIRDSLTAKKYKILEWIYLVIAAVLVVFVIGLVATGHYPESFSTGECALVIFIAVFAAIVLYFAWFGQIKRQFNSVLKKGYPDKYDELKINIIKE